MSWPRKPDSTQQMCPQSRINREWGALLHLFHREQNRPDFTAASTEEFFTGTIIHQKITLSSIYSMKVPLRNLSLHLGSHPSLAQPKHPTVCSLKQGSWKTMDKGIPDLGWRKADVTELVWQQKLLRNYFSSWSGLQTSNPKKFFGKQRVYKPFPASQGDGQTSWITADQTPSSPVLRCPIRIDKSR